MKKFIWIGIGGIFGLIALATVVITFFVVQDNLKHGIRENGYSPTEAGPALSWKAFALPAEPPKEGEFVTMTKDGAKYVPALDLSRGGFISAEQVEQMKEDRLSAIEQRLEKIEKMLREKK